MHSLETTIEDLVASNLISVRLANVCRSKLGINFAHQLLQVDEHTIMNIPGAGAKSRAELVTFKARYSNLPVSTPSLFDEEYEPTLAPGQKLINTKDAAKIAFSRADIDDETRHYFIECYGRNFPSLIATTANLKQLVHRPTYLDANVNQSLRNALIKLVNEMSRIDTLSLFEKEKITSQLPLMVVEAKYLRAKEKFDSLPSMVRRNLEERLKTEFAKRSIRCQNSMAEFKNLNRMVDAIIKNEQISREKYNHCGEKTISEFGVLFSEFRRYYFERLDEISDAPISFDQAKKLAADEFSRRFPYLNDEEIEHLCRYEYELKPLPFLKIMLDYIRRVNQPANIIYRRYYGLGEDNARSTMADIATELKISSERVRQITTTNIRLTPELKALSRPTLDLFTERIIKDDAPIWERLIKENALTIDTSRVMGLIAILNSNYTLLEIEETSRKYLIKKSILKEVKVRTAISDFKNIAKRTRHDDELIDISPLVRQNRPREIFDEHLEELFPIFLECYKTITRSEIIDSSHILLHSNKQNYIRAIEQILEENSAPMTYKQILDEYNKRYPNYPFGTKDSLHSYILRSQRIAAKGRTGVYALREWEQHGEFNGTLTDYIFHLINQAGHPLTLDEIYKDVTRQYPGTSRNSVNSVIQLDSARRFTLLNNGLYGISSWEYNDNEIRQAGRMRHTAAERLDELEEFINTNNRFPLNSGPKEEHSLYTWISNIIHQNVNATDDDIARFEQLKETYRQLPRTADEYNFLKRCDEIRAYVKKNNALPKFKTAETLYIWLKQAILRFSDAPTSISCPTASLNTTVNIHGQLTDNRPTYLSDLLSDLATIGHPIPQPTKQ